MLSPISWQEFITAIVIAALAYYAIASVLFYRHEILTFFRHGKFNIMPELRHVLRLSRSLLGAIRHERPARQLPREEKSDIDEIDLIPLSQPGEEITEAQQKDRSVSVEISSLAERISKSSR